MQPLEEWWYSLLNNADTIIHDQVLKIDEINIVQKSHLLENFNQHAKEHNYKHRAWSAQRFGLQIKNFYSNWKHQDPQASLVYLNFLP